MDIKVTEATGLANDQVRVRGLVDGVEVEAFGWRSALTNHYDPKAYDPETGHRHTAPAQEAEKMSAEEASTIALVPRDEPRAMTKDERMTYFEGLLAAAVPEPEVDLLA